VGWEKRIGEACRGKEILRRRVGDLGRDAWMFEGEGGDWEGKGLGWMVMPKE
jgi:hypothetical protein